MRGGLVACVTEDGTGSADLCRIAGHLRWHRGGEVELVDGRLHALLFVDDAHGPVVERCDRLTVIAHGTSPQPLRALSSGSSRFAALEWDGQTLRAIRDPMGEVPLYYRRDARGVWFSTETGPLAALGAAIPDLEAITATATGFPLAERTGWEGVLRLLPGEILEVNPTLEVARWRYWDPSALFGRFHGGPEAALSEFRRRFERAVARTTGRATGILLSGGLDSSSVAVVASRLRDATLQPAGCDTLLGVGYPSVPEVDESRYAEAVADTTGLPLRWVEGRLDRWDPRTEVNAFGVPGVALPTGVLDTALPAFAAEGCDVVLDGHDGDGVVGHAFANHANALLHLQAGPLVARARQAGWPRVLRTIASEVLPPSLRMRRLRRRSTVREDVERDLPYFRGRTRARFLAEFGWRPPRSGWRYQQVRILLPPFIQHLEELEAIGARYGVDLRHPFADRDLVEFMVSLPYAVKASPARTKPVLRDALADLLPPLVRDRTDKREFSPVIDRRVDYGACLDVIAESGVRLPDVDYERLFRESDPSRECCAWIRLARAHVFAAGAVR